MEEEVGYLSVTSVLHEVKISFWWIVGPPEFVGSFARANNLLLPNMQPCAGSYTMSTIREGSKMQPCANSYTVSKAQGIRKQKIYLTTWSYLFIFHPMVLLSINGGLEENYLWGSHCVKKIYPSKGGPTLSIFEAAWPTYYPSFPLTRPT